MLNEFENFVKLREYLKSNLVINHLDGERIEL